MKNNTQYTFLAGIVLLTCLLSLPLSSAQLVYSNDHEISLKIPCIVDGRPCSASALCNLTAQYPNSSSFIINKAMTYSSGGDFSYNLNFTALGFYPSKVSCSDAGQNGTSTFDIQITPNGENPSTANGILYLGLLGVLIIFLVMAIAGIFKMENSLIGRFAFLNVAYLLLMAVLFVSWSMANDFLTGSPFIASMLKVMFYFSMYAFFPYFLCTMFWMIYMVITVKEIQTMMDKGIPEDEAYERTIKKGFRRKF